MGSLWRLLHQGSGSPGSPGSSGSSGSQGSSSESPRELQEFHHTSLTFSRTSRNVAHAKRRHVVRRVRPRARPASAGRAIELSGCETAAGIECDAQVAGKLPGRPTDQDLQAVCRRRIDVLIGCSAPHVGGVTRPADHPFAARRCLTIEPVAHRQSSPEG